MTASEHGAYPDIYEENGFKVFDCFEPAELEAARALVRRRYLHAIEDTYPHLAEQFRSLPTTRYHELNHLIDHRKTWIKAYRVLPPEDSKKFSKLGLIDRLRELIGDFEVCGIDDVGWEEFWWRIVRPGEVNDVAPLHADQWYHELGDGYYPPGSTICKIWVPLHSNPMLNGLEGIPMSALSRPDNHYVGELRHGIVKPRIADDLVDENALITIPVHEGQAVTFTNSFIHRGKVNRADFSRISIEFAVLLGARAERAKVAAKSANLATDNVRLTADRQACAERFSLLEVEFPKNAISAVPFLDDEVLAYLKALGTSRNLNFVLDVGSYVAVNAIRVADALGVGKTRVVSLEENRETADVAQRNVTRNGFGESIEVVRGKTNVILPIVADANTIDLVLAPITAGAMIFSVLRDKVDQDTLFLFYGDGPKGLSAEQREAFKSLIDEHRDDEDFQITELNFSEQCVAVALPKTSFSD
ncbi:MAG: phytanoyl-CoA dioxygenase family protein [Pseudomonadota bacterium]